MAGDIIKGREHFFTTTYVGNGLGQKIGQFVPFTDSGTISKSLMFNNYGSSPNHRLYRTLTEGNNQIATFSAWIKFLGPHNTSGDSYTGYGGIIEMGNGNWTSSSHFMFYVMKGQLEFYLGGTNYLRTNNVFVDTSQWYHIVMRLDVTQASAANRLRFYVNGTEITSFATDARSSLSQDTDLSYINSNSNQFNLGGMPSGNGYQDLPCYMAEVNYIDGTSYGPETFGQTDTSTGRWIPKSLGSITYGTNGFRLQFANSAGQTIGDDTSGQGNDLSLNNINTADLYTNTPTNQIAVMRPWNMAYPQTMSEGNLSHSVTGTNAGYPVVPTIAPSSGKWYAEARTSTNGGGNVIAIGAFIYEDMDKWDNTYNFWPGQGGSDGCGAGLEVRNDGNNWLKTRTSAGAQLITSNPTYTVAAGDVFGIAVDRDNDLISFYGNNGSLIGSTTLPPGRPLFCAVDVLAAGNWTWNFGDNPTFNGNETAGDETDANGEGNFYHSVPTGFKMLKRDNLSDKDKGIEDGPSFVKPDLVWIKNRDSTDGHQVYDSTRGPLLAQRTDTEAFDSTTSDGLQEFLVGGCTVSDDVATNTVDERYVAWNWVANGGTTSANSDGSGATLASTIQANQTAGFSIVTYTGDATAGRKVAHGLSQAPDWIWITNRTATSGSATGPKMYHHKNTAAPETDYLALSTTDATYDAIFLNDTAPDAKCFTIGPTGYATNNNGSTYVAYCWHEVPGFSRFGSYTANDNVDGPFIYTGFKPAFVMIKNTASSYSYGLFDSERDRINPVSSFLAADATTVYSDQAVLDFLSNGFKIRIGNSSWTNHSTNAHVYMAFAEHPFNGNGENAFATAR